LAIASAIAFAQSSQILLAHKSNLDHYFNQPVFNIASAIAFAQSSQI
jgi:hypothetical protein